MANPVVHFEVQAKDAAKAQEFYASLFGWEIDTNNPMKYGIVKTGAEHGIGGGIGEAMGGGPKVTFYVEVPDPEATLKQAEAKGAKRLMGPEEVPGGPTIALFADPEGNVIGLTKAM
jgi:predicted enzyme related to lactoylglutathione lyase